MQQSGLFDIQTPQDLLKKAKHDLKRLQNNPLDAYAAFDFFVTVRHLPDWLYPNDVSAKDALFKKHVEMRVARHIADNAKHFWVTHPMHKQVTGTSAIVSVLQSSPSEPQTVRVKALVVELDSRDIETSLFDKREEALPLAERVYEVAKTIVLVGR